MDRTISKANLLAAVMEFKAISLRSIHKYYGVNPADEMDRVKVWKIGQGLAELYREKFIDIGTSTGERWFFKV